LKYFVVSTNYLLATVGSFFLLFMSWNFFIGDKNHFVRMNSDLPFSFLQRWGGFTLLGAIGVLFLFVITLLLNLLIFNDNKINLIRVTLSNLSIIAIGSFIG